MTTKYLSENTPLKEIKLLFLGNKPKSSKSVSQKHEDQ